MSEETFCCVANDSIDDLNEVLDDVRCAIGDLRRWSGAPSPAQYRLMELNKRQEELLWSINKRTMKSR